MSTHPSGRLAAQNIPVVVLSTRLEEPTHKRDQDTRILQNEKEGSRELDDWLGVPVPGRRETVERFRFNRRNCLGCVPIPSRKELKSSHVAAPIEHRGLELGYLLRREAGGRGPEVESHTRILMLKLRQASD